MFLGASMLFFSFCISALAGNLQPLYAAKAESTSFLKSSWNQYTENYHPNYVLDNNPKTAWVEGVDGNGENESIIIPISSVDKVHNIQLRIRNGYQKSTSLLKANGAPNGITITLLSRHGAKVEELQASLLKKMDWQRIDIPISDPQKSIGLVQITINSVHPGTKYKDTCISDIEIHVDAQSPYKKEVEENKKTQLQQWVQQRLRDAQFFANKPKEYPFETTVFLEKETALSKEDFEAHYKLISTLSRDETWSQSYFTRENKSPLKALPDALDDLPTDIWRLSDLALFETNKQYALFINQKEIDTETEYTPPSRRNQSNFRRAIRKDGSTSRLSYMSSYEECERGCYTMEIEYTIIYEGNQVSHLISSVEYKDMGPEGGSKTISIYSFASHNKKITGFTLYTKRSFEDWNSEFTGKPGEEEFHIITEYDKTEYTSAQQ